MSVHARAAILALLLASACAPKAALLPPMTPVVESAPAVLVTHFEADVHLVRPRLTRLRKDEDTGFSGALDIGFESANCCGLGAYVQTSGYGDGRGASNVLDGGLQLEMIAPWWENRIRLRGRAGKATTAPGGASLGRPGFAASLVALVRIWNPETPPLNTFGGDVDAFIGYSNLSLLESETSAGPLEKPFALRGVLIGLRIGAEYGVEYH